MRNRYKGLNYIFADLLLKSLGLTLSALYTIYDIPVLVVIGNVCIFTGSISLLLGLGQFLRVRIDRYPYVALTVFFTVLYSYFTFAYPSTRTRLLIFTCLSILVLINGLRVIYVLADEESREYASSVGVVISLLLLVNTYRAYNGFQNFAPLTYDTLIDIETFSILISSLLIVLLTFSLIQMLHKKLMYETEESNKKMMDMVEASRIRASIDPLTEVMNRKKIEELLLVLMDQFRIYHDTFTIMLIDIDHFKRFNTAFDHQTGDKVLQEVANTLQQNLRKNDVVGRWGDEEFIVLLHATDENYAEQLGELLIEKVRERHILSENIPERVTISVGCSEMKADFNLNRLLINADEALHKAKAEGRNQIRVYKEQVV